MKNEIVDWHNYTIHTEKEKVNRYRRVTYNTIDFDILIFTITENGKTRFFAIHADELRKAGRNKYIHFTYNSSKDIRWRPDNIALHVKEFHPRQVCVKKNILISHEQRTSLLGLCHGEKWCAKANDSKRKHTNKHIYNNETQNPS